MAARNKNTDQKVSMPEHVKPMLCTLVKDPVENEAYIFELKWDGYRILSRVEKGDVRMEII